MSKYSTSSFRRSLSYAFRGLAIAFKSQQNFRTQVLLGFMAFWVATILKFSAIEFCILVLIMGMVLLCELFNSVIEFTLDAVYKNKYSKLVAMAKDMSAGAVLISSFASILSGAILFLHRIYEIFQRGMII